MESTFKILCLEDSLEDFGLINHYLKKGNFSFSAARVESKDEFLRALDDLSFNLVLSDHSLPQFDSLEALKIVRANSPNLPFILVTGAVSEEFAVNCLKLGADDYVLKKNLKDLPQVIENAVRVREEEARKTKQAKELAIRNQELSKLNKELDSFVYSVSHNIRAPLRSILGLLSLSKGERDPEAIHTYHELMEKSIQKLDNNLIEILEYSRNSTQELRVEEVDINQLIDEGFEKLMFMPGFDKLSKEVKVEQDAPYFSDAYRVSVIFNNLISNAIKYRDPAKSQSFLKIHGKVTKDELVVNITDNGIGIDQDQLPKLFKMFSRATSQSEGAGLGLYIVKEAVELLKGKVEISSTAGEGTTFTLRIPNYL
jgi:signal transduction histidine kinase